MLISRTFNANWKGAAGMSNSTNAKKRKPGQCASANVDRIALRFCGMPTSAQKDSLNQTLGACRWLYNRMLYDRSACYKQTGESLNLTPAWYKRLSCCPWLKEADSLALANVHLHLNRAFDNFFNGKSAYPKFKRKADHYDSYTTNIASKGATNLRFRMGKRKAGFLTLPKIGGEIKVRAHRAVPAHGILKSVTVTHEPDGKYYFSLLYEVPHEEIYHDIDPDNAIGLDMSMHNFYVDSNGKHIDYGKPYHDMQNRIAKEQRKLSHMKKGSSNYHKQRVKVAKLCAKAKHQRSDALHKLSRQLVDTYDIVGIEDLNMKAMSQSLNFGKSVGDKGWGMFANMLAYKAQRAGKRIIKVGKFFPSSQMCHECGTLHKLTKDLSVREWTCPNCGHPHDRDENAALNIRDEAVRIYCTC